MIRLGKRGTFLGRFEVGRWGWVIALMRFDEPQHWALRLFCLWVTLGRAGRPPVDDMLDKWGVSLHFREACLALNWRERYKHFHMPWGFEWVRTEVMLYPYPGYGCVGRFRRFTTTEQASRWPRWLGGRRLYRRETGRLTPAVDVAVSPTVPASVRAHLETHTATEPLDRYVLKAEYRYTLRSGEVQVRTATVTVGRMTWAMRGLWKVGIWFPKKVRTSINVEFSDEVGERTGSWKGGTVGCGYDLLPHETPYECLKRMERERKF